MTFTIAVQKWAFNPDLALKMGRVYGTDEDGEAFELTGVILKSEGDSMTVRDLVTGESTIFRIDAFGTDKLQLEVYGVPEPCVFPEGFNPA